jgi:hypothetical protein
VVLLCTETYALKFKQQAWTGSAKDVRLMREKLEMGTVSTEITDAQGATGGAADGAIQPTSSA